MCSNPELTAISQNKQEQGRINEKQPKQAKTAPDNIGELLLTKYLPEYFIVTPYYKRF